MLFKLASCLPAVMSEIPFTGAHARLAVIRRHRGRAAPGPCLLALLRELGLEGWATKLAKLAKRAVRGVGFGFAPCIEPSDLRWLELADFLSIGMVASSGLRLQDALCAASVAPATAKSAAQAAQLALAAHGAQRLAGEKLGALLAACAAALFGPQPVDDVVRAVTPRIMCFGEWAKALVDSPTCDLNQASAAAIPIAVGNAFVRSLRPKGSPRAEGAVGEAISALKQAEIRCMEFLVLKAAMRSPLGDKDGFEAVLSAPEALGPVAFTKKDTRSRVLQAHSLAVKRQFPNAFASNASNRGWRPPRQRRAAADEPQRE